MRQARSTARVVRSLALGLTATLAAMASLVQAAETGKLALSGRPASAAAPAGPCCDLSPGDRVEDVYFGMQGTVVCCDSDDPELTLLVTWDGLTGEGGHEQCFWCDEPYSCTFPEGSALWAGCADIIAIGGGACGDPGTGDCLEANGTPFCEDADCCEAVCAADAFCCTTGWDDFCAGAAALLPECGAGGACGDPGSGSCLAANGTPFCEDADCCETVCAVDAYCCEVGWDASCADAASVLPVCGGGGACGDAGSGSCLAANGTPFCEDADCCETVCATDPYCCGVEWDETCADAASVLPECAGGGGDCEPNEAVTAPGSWSGNTCGTGNDCEQRPSEEYVYQVTLPQSGGWTFSLCGSSYDTYLRVGTSPGGQEIGYNDDSCGAQSELTVDGMAAGTYYVTIEGFIDSSCGAYTLSITGGGGCAPDYTVTGPGTWSGDTCGAGNDCGERPSQEHVYEVTLEEQADWVFSLCGSSYDTYLLVGTAPGASDIGFNDDACEVQSEVVAPDLPAGTYFVTIEAYSSSGCGDYELTVEELVCDPPVPPRPDPADGATDVPVDVVLSWGGEAARAAAKGPKIIYGSDDRLDEYEVSDPAILAVGDATVVLVSTSALHDNGNGTYSLPTETFADYVLYASGDPLCSYEPFRDQPNPGFCSGFLVAPNVIATAGHCVASSGDCADVAFVFGFVMSSPTMPVLTVPASEVYYCNRILAREQAAADWGLIELDRPVVGHTPLTVRSSGQVPTGDPLMVIGHPVGLPRKYAGGATVRDNSPAEYFQANLDTYGGNSGSAVFNSSTVEVEGILVRGPQDFVWEGSCWRSNVCSDTGCPGWEDVTRATEFSELLPSFDVYFGECSGTVEPLGTTVAHTWAMDPLQPGTTYCWYVVAENHCGQTRAPAEGYWEFTTAFDGEPVQVTAWRSVRTHGDAGPLGIALDAAAAGANATSEPRLGGIQTIEVDFDHPVSLVGGAIQVANLTDGGSIPADGQTLVNGDQTLVLSLDAGTLPDQKCYRIDLTGHIPDLAGDTDCVVRGLEGDTDNNGQVELADAILAFDLNLQPVDAGNARFDVDLNGSMELADAILAFDRNLHQATCP